MILYKLLSASLLAGVLPLVSAAQTTPDSPRYYVGVGGSVLNGFSSGDSRIFGPSLTAGLQLKPRLAVQIGTTVTWRNYSSSFIYIDAQQGQTVYTNTSHSNFITVPALLRYTLTPAAAAKRLQVDALVGLSLLVNTSRGTSTTLYPDKTQYESSNRYSNLRSSLVLGPALRYSLTPRVALTAEVPVNLVIGTGSLSNSLFYNLQVGARYNFG